MEAFELADLVTQQEESGQAYFEFIRNSSLSTGVYALPAGGVDRQTPHEADEVYFIIRGKGVVNVAGEDRAVAPGSIISVAAGVEHFFHLITEDLMILVFFAAPGRSRQRHE